MRFIVILLLGLLVCASPAQETTIPKWAFDAVEQMKKNGVLVGYPDGLIYHAPRITRDRIAVAAHATYMHMKNMADSLDLEIAKNPSDPLLKKDAELTMGWSKDVRNLGRLIAEFDAELRALGVDPGRVSKDIRRLERFYAGLPKRFDSFSDVPGDHWASGAVHDLRKLGILTGYPEITFLGG